MKSAWDPRRLVVDDRSRAFSLIVLAVYVALTLLVNLQHEPWRDEADP